MGKWQYQPRGRAQNRAQEWPFEREGYSDQPQAAYAAAPTANVEVSHSGRLASFLGSVLAGAGGIWTARVASQSNFDPSALTLNSHPIELTGIGILIWLYGKYRKSVAAR